MTEFSLVLWLKIDRLDYDTRAVLFDTFQDFSCSYHQSTLACNELTLDFDLEPDLWYIVVLQSQLKTSKLWLASYDLEPIVTAEMQGFFPTGLRSIWPKTATLGQGLNGSMRNVQLFRKFLTLAELKVAPFTYLHPYSDLAMMVTLQSLDSRDINENSCDRQPLSKTGSPELLYDQSANKFCFQEDYPLTATDVLPYQLEVFPSVQLMPYIMTSTYDLYSTTMSRFFTLRMWFQRIPISGRDQQDQVLFEHDGVMKVFLSGLGFIGISAAGGSMQTYQTAAVPYNQWMYLEAIVNVKQFGVTVINQDSTVLMTSYSSQGWELHRQTLRPKYYVWVAQDFSGVIYALRYATESSHASQPPERPVNLPPIELTAPNILLSFSFTQEMRFENFGFANLARKYQSGELLPQQQIIGTLNIDYKQTIWHDPGEPFQAGVITEPSDFDGVTCKSSNSQNLQITAAPSIALTEFYLSELDVDILEEEFTVEFWYRPTRRIDSDLIQLFQISRDGIPVISISKENSQLFCYPQLPQRDTGSRLHYTDFSETDYTWQHITCSYSLKHRQIKGTLLKNQIQWQYFAIVQNEPLQVLQEGDYKLSIGNNLYYSQTYSGLQVKEVRLWNRALSTNEINSHRFKQIELQPELMLYLKLQSSYHKELVRGGEVKFQDVIWVSNTVPLLICPLDTYHNAVILTSVSSNEQGVCYRDLFKEQLRVKISSTQDGTYILMPFLTTQADESLFGNQTSMQFNWQYIGQDVLSDTQELTFTSSDLSGKVEERSTQTFLILNNEEVSNRGAYTLKLLMNAGPMMLSQQVEFPFRTDYCSGLLDANTQEPWVVQDINQNRGSTDIVLNYEVQQCSDLIAKYKLKRIYFEILNQPQVQGRLYFETSSVVIPARQQANLPLNDYFYIVATAEWSNLETKQQAFELTLVYQLRFVSKIQISLSAVPTAVARGQSLVLDSSKTQILNLQNDQIDKVSFDRSWVCPLKLQPYCQSTGEKLTISYAAFTKANLQYWTTYSISVVARPNFVQGDGSQLTTATTQVLWVNLAPGDGVIQGLSEVDVGQSSLYTVDFNEIIEDEVEIKWKITPEIGSSYLQPLNQRQVNFQTNTLVPDTLYYLKASLIFKSELSEVISSANFKIQTLPQPERAYFRVTPPSGTALVTQFTFSLSGWANNRTSQFQFFIQPHDSSEWRVLTEKEGPRNSRTMVMELPACKAVAVRVYWDETTSYTQVEYSLDVQYDKVKSEAALLAQGLDSLLTVLSMEDLQDEDTQRSLIESSVTKLNASFSNSTSLRIQLQRLDRITCIQKLYDRKQGTLIQQYIKSLVNSDNFDLNLGPLRDDEQMMLLLKVQSNLLKGCEWLEISRQFSSWNTDADIVYVTESVRQLLVSFEESYSFLLAESDVFNVTLPAFTIYIGKYSSMTQEFQDVEGNLGTKLAYVYPLTASCQQSVRQTLTLIAFRANPFLGSHPSNQTVVSNTTLYVSYRDVYGYPLSAKCVKQVLSTVFFYKFTPYFVEQVTTCGFYTEQNAKFLNTSCETTFNKSNDRFTCFCGYKNQPVWYSVLEDYFIRPLPPPPEFATFKDWATFGTLAYTCCFSLIGLMYTYGQDLADFKHLRDIKLKKDSELMKQRDLPLDLVSLAQKRQVSMMPYADQFTTTRYWLLLLLQTHPLLQLRYQLDPQLQKLNKFAIYMCRLWVSMLSTFLMLGKAGSTLSPVYIALIVVALSIQILLLTSLPNAFYDRLKHRYRLRVSPNASKVLTDTKRIIFIDEVVYECDTNLPIRLLFILNAMPLLNKNEDLGHMRFASGKAIDLCEKLIAMDSKETIYKEGGEVETKRADNSVDSEPDEEDSPGKNNHSLGQQTQSEYESEDDDGDGDGQGLGQDESYYESSEYVTEKTEPNNLMEKDNFNMIRTGTQISSNQKVDYRVRSPADEDHDIIETEEDRAEINARDPKMGALKVGSQHSTSLSHHNSTHSAKLFINQREPSNLIKHFSATKTPSKRKQSLQNDKTLPQNELTTMSMPNISVNDVLVEEDNSKVGKDKEDSHRSSQPNASMSSLDSQVFEKEKKEFFEADYNLESSAWLYGIICFAVAAFLAPAIYIFVAQKIFAEEVNYIWVSVYFGGQFLSIFVVNPIVCYVIAAHVARVRRKAKQEKAELYFLCKWLRESLIIYEDYQFAVQFQKTRIN